MKRIIQITIIFVFNICLAQINYGKDICFSGIILSEVNNKPLNDAVFVVYQNSGTFSDENGLFKLTIPIEKDEDKLKLSFRIIGYKTFDTIVETNKSEFENLKIILKPLQGYISKEQALLDIDQDNLKFYLFSGIAPTYYKSQKKFSEKFKVEYVEFGCEPIATESLEEYNGTIAKYLDEKYGNKWRRKVRKDIVGI